jgi:hypothetical protein
MNGFYICDTLRILLLLVLIYKSHLFVSTMSVFHVFIFEQCIPVVFINNYKYKCIFGIYSLTQLAKVYT